MRSTATPRGQAPASGARSSLAESHWLAGDEYSVADIITFPWIRARSGRNIDLAEYPSVKRWHDENGGAARGAAGRRRIGRPGAAGVDYRRRAENYFGKAQFAAR